MAPAAPRRSCAWSSGSRRVDSTLNKLANKLLLHLHPLVGVQDKEIELGAHGEVLLEDAALENPKAFIGIG